MTTVSPQNPPPELRPGFNPARVIVLLLAGAFFLLMLDIREEHAKPLLHGYWIPWIPIVYSGMMLLCCTIGFFRWHQPVRRLLWWLFLLGVAVGLTGFWFHNHGHPLNAVMMVVKSWSWQPLPHGGQPPSLAPLAFVGLGFIGMICTSQWAQRN